MTTKKASKQEVSDETVSAHDNLNRLYTAHQVHTLAQLLCSRLGGGWQVARPWLSAAPTSPQVCTPTMNAPLGAMGWTAPMPGTGSPAFVQGPPPALVYWYP